MKGHKKRDMLIPGNSLVINLMTGKSFAGLLLSVIILAVLSVGILL
jgi:hypothetical protein